MTRILDLQKLDTAAASEIGPIAGSTSSWVGCTCSTNSLVSCKVQDQFVAI